MTYPRAHLVDPSGGVYHVCSRCVRRAWLCGRDELTGYNFDHRRDWLENRILELAEIFAIDLYGYAVMSNHYHIVLHLDPSKSTWSDEDAILAAMIYVDLNPVRAGIAENAGTATHTSLQKRLTEISRKGKMTALNQPNAALPFAYHLDEYVDLANWTAEAQQDRRPTRSYKRGPPGDRQLWLHHYLPTPGCWQRANGSFQSLRDYAKDIGQCWIKTRSVQLQQ